MKNLIRVAIAGTTIMAIATLASSEALAHGKKRVFFRNGFKVVKTVRYNPHTGYKIVRKVRTHLRSGRRMVIVKRFDPWGGVSITRRSLGSWRGYHPRKTHGWRRARRW